MHRSAPRPLRLSECDRAAVLTTELETLQQHVMTITS
jgi:hypothetical protein